MHIAPFFVLFSFQVGCMPWPRAAIAMKAGMLYLVAHRASISLTVGGAFRDAHHAPFLSHGVDCFAMASLDLSLCNTLTYDVKQGQKLICLLKLINSVKRGD